jgi:hypothetical protein
MKKKNVKQVLLGVGGGGQVKKLKESEYGWCTLYICMKLEKK